MRSSKEFNLSSLLSCRFLPRCDHSVRFVTAPCHRAKPLACFSSSSADNGPDKVSCFSRKSKKPQRVPHSWTAAQDAMRTQADKELLRTASEQNMSDLEMVAAYFPNRSKYAVEAARHRLHFDQNKLTSRRRFTVSIKKWSKRDEEIISKAVSLGKSARTISEESFPDRTYDSVRNRMRDLKRRALIEADALPDLASEELILSLHSQGLSIIGIASEAEVSEDSVRQCLKERSIRPNKPQKVLRTRWIEVDVAKLLALDDAGTKASRIAKLLGRSETSILSKLKRSQSEDKSRSIDEEELKSAIEWHEKGASYSDIADRLKKRLHIVVTTMTAKTGEPLGEPQAIRPWTWANKAKRPDANQHSAPVLHELEQSQDSST